MSLESEAGMSNNDAKRKKVSDHTVEGFDHDGTNGNSLIDIQGPFSLLFPYVSSDTHATIVHL